MQLAKIFIPFLQDSNKGQTSKVKLKSQKCDAQKKTGKVPTENEKIPKEKITRQIIQCILAEQKQA